MIDEARKLAEEVREYTAMKYAGDCKCGKCQLVPRALVERIYHTLNGTCTVAQTPANPVSDAMQRELDGCRHAVSTIESNRTGSKTQDRNYAFYQGKVAGLEYALVAMPIAPAQEAPAPVAWRVTDGEGDYEYLTEEPSDQSRAWSRRYGREWEPLYASPVSSAPSEAAKAAPDREQLIECISRFDVFSTAAQVADAILDLSLSSTELCCPGGCMFTPCKVSSTHKSGAA